MTEGAGVLRILLHVDVLAPKHYAAQGLWTLRHPEAHPGIFPVASHLPDSSDQIDA